MWWFGNTLPLLIAFIVCVASANDDNTIIKKNAASSEKSKSGWEDTFSSSNNEAVTPRVFVPGVGDVSQAVSEAFQALENQVSGLQSGHSGGETGFKIFVADGSDPDLAATLNAVMHGEEVEGVVVEDLWIEEGPTQPDVLQEIQEKALHAAKRVGEPSKSQSKIDLTAAPNLKHFHSSPEDPLFDDVLAVIPPTSFLAMYPHHPRGVFSIEDTLSIPPDAVDNPPTSLSLWVAPIQAPLPESAGKATHPRLRAVQDRVIVAKEEAFSGKVGSKRTLQVFHHVANDGLKVSVMLRNGTTAFLTLPDVLPSAVWTHVAISVQGDLLVVFINAELTASRRLPGPAAVRAGKGKYTVGSEVMGSTFVGYVDAIEAVNRTLGEEDALLYFVETIPQWRLDTAYFAPDPFFLLHAARVSAGVLDLTASYADVAGKEEGGRDSSEAEGGAASNRGPRAAGDAVHYEVLEDLIARAKAEHGVASHAELYEDASLAFYDPTGGFIVPEDYAEFDSALRKLWLIAATPPPPAQHTQHTQPEQTTKATRPAPESSPVPSSQGRSGGSTGASSLDGSQATNLGAEDSAPDSSRSGSSPSHSSPGTAADSSRTTNADADDVYAAALLLLSQIVMLEPSADVASAVLILRECVAQGELSGTLDGHCLFSLGVHASLGYGTPRNVVLARSLYARACMAGSHEACMACGSGHLFGHPGFPLSPELSLHYLTPLSQLADTYVEASGGYMYDAPVYLPDPGLELPSEEADIVDFVQYEADFHADADALMEMGNIRYFGMRGHPQDYGEALRYFHAAADQGQADAMHSLGVMYAKGEGVAADGNRSAEFFHMAADRGHASAQNGLGYIYMYGVGVGKDARKAREYFELAAAQGVPEAMFNLAMIHRGHLGAGSAPRNLTTSVEWLEQAVAYGHVQSLSYLGRAYTQGEGVERDVSKGGDFYKALAEYGEWVAPLFDAYYMYEDGHAVLATAMYLQAAEMGLEIASLNTAWLLEEGYELPFVYTKADESVAGVPLHGWWDDEGAGDYDAILESFASLQGLDLTGGDGAMMFDPSEFLLNGLGDPGELVELGNLEEALRSLGGSPADGDLLMMDEAWWDTHSVRFELYARAADYGNPDALVMKGDLLSTGKGVHQDHEVAYESYVSASEAGSARALFNLGYMCEHGLGTEKDHVKALEFYDQAILEDPFGDSYLPGVLARTKLEGAIIVARVQEGTDPLDAVRQLLVDRGYTDSALGHMALALCDRDLLLIVLVASLLWVVVVWWMLRVFR